jgi:hypothetical protein
MIREAASLDQLKDQIDAAYPGRSISSDGWVGDAAHAARVSDHNPDADGVVRARDFTEDLAIGLSMNQIAEDIRVSRDKRVKYVIHEGRMFSSYSTSARAAWEWGPYTGINAHLTHMHVSVLGPSSVYDDRSEWQIGVQTMFIARGAKGQMVEWWQRKILRINPNLLPLYGADGDYGQEMAAAVALLCGTDGSRINPGDAEVIEAKYAMKLAGSGGLSEAQVKSLAASAASGAVAAHKQEPKPHPHNHLLSGATGTT